MKNNIETLDEITYHNDVLNLDYVDADTYLENFVPDETTMALINTEREIYMNRFLDDVKWLNYVIDNLENEDLEYDKREAWLTALYYIHTYVEYFVEDFNDNDNILWKDINIDIFHIYEELFPNSKYSLREIVEDDFLEKCCDKLRSQYN